jgi:G3E family GTPase
VARSVKLQADYALDGVVALADAETVRQRAADRYMGDTIDRQLAEADLVLGVCVIRSFRLPALSA